MLGITHRGVKMPNIQIKSLIFTSFMIFSKILGGSIIINVSIANLELLVVAPYKRKEFFRTRRLKNHFN